ncbi:hypothetical protein ASE01_09655 [Nocardioides sp. Root190]|uniref:hypothetical protein n=1 Tax=Nocardioides sp. Root190 TaxID=1736488 RepID=UPI000700726A|nr:hypothetical protein [Nocardioides sp. Root190]KRB77019.1 hypothetical protein ASE01_09655 [Nocardioides sp. Root190]
MQKGLDDTEGRFTLPRWAWRSGAVTIAVVLFVTGESVAAIAAVVAFSVAEVVFDAAELERD